MSNSNESFASVRPEGGTSDEASGPVIGPIANHESQNLEFIETMQLRSLQDQQLASSRDQLKRSATRLLSLLEMDAPSNLLCRELALITQRIGGYHNCLLDVSSP